MISTLAGGFVAKKYGSTSTVAGCLAMITMISMITPATAHVHFVLCYVFRFFTGIFTVSPQEGFL